MTTGGGVWVKQHATTGQWLDCSTPCSTRNTPATRSMVDRGNEDREVLRLSFAPSLILGWAAGWRQNGRRRAEHLEAGAGGAGRPALMTPGPGSEARVSFFFRRLFDFHFFPR